MRVFNFSVEDELYKAVKIDAVNEGKTTKQYLKDALTHYLKQKEQKKIEC